jgi:Zn-dependent protease with chaperone function
MRFPMLHRLLTALPALAVACAIAGEPAAPDILAVLQRSQQQRLDGMVPAEAGAARARKVQDSFTVLVRSLEALPPATELRVVGGELIAETLHGRVVVANEKLADLPEGERLFVLAHELGHVQLGHWDQMCQLYQKWVPGPVLQSYTDAIAGPLGREGSALAYRQEFEADAFGLRTLQKMGLSEQDVLSAFRDLGLRHDTPTHPGTRRRVAALRSLDH